MAELSPQAQAVLRAAEARWLDVDDDIPAQVVIAALRAAADQVKYEYPLFPEYTEWDAGHDAGIQRVINKILAIATELENHQ